MEKVGGDKRRAFKELKNQIERRLPLCPVTWRHESHKIEFLRDTLVMEDCAENTLSWVGASTSWRGLYTELENALQIRVEREGDTYDVIEPSTSSSSKPNIVFSAPIYARRFSKAMFPGSQYDYSCWNCEKKGHSHTKCFKPINFEAIAARKAAFINKKQNGGSSSKRVLHELVEG